jgi:hypothetical protein
MKHQHRMEERVSDFQPPAGRFFLYQAQNRSRSSGEKLNVRSSPRIDLRIGQDNITTVRWLSIRA